MPWTRSAWTPSSRSFEHDLFDRFLIPVEYRDFIRRSWERDEHTIYGRFDLAFDGATPPKLLEYNADTPTALLEAAVIQWFWLKDRLPDAQQFNCIHERLLEVFQAIRKETAERFYFSAMAGCLEDYMTVNYLRDVAMQAGFDTEYLDVEQIGWHAGRGVFTDLRENPIGWCFKLYPWEWMQREAFGPHLLRAPCRWFEPPWKALLSNKAILAVLWELYPRQPVPAGNRAGAAPRGRLREEAHPRPRGGKRPDLRARQALPGDRRALTTARPSIRRSGRCRNSTRSTLP